MARLIGVLAVLLGIAALAAIGVTWWWGQALDAPGPATEAVVVEVPAGASLARVAARLEEAGVVRRADVLEWYGRLSGQAGQVRAGEYNFPPGSSTRAVMARLVSGETVLHALTVVEGWTFRQLRAAIEAHPAIGEKLPDAPDEELMSRLGMPDMAPEGWFLPETYRFARGTSELELLALAHRAMVAALDEAWAGRADGIPLETPYEALILASIIEKETGQAGERATIGSVFVNRLRVPMRLQTDPTVIYGLGARFDGNLRKRDLVTDTPWNTYTRDGLPPTPIAMPGQASIDAAVRPARTPYLYFVGRGDGSHQFSRTLEEHNRAVAKYQLGRS